MRVSGRFASSRADGMAYSANFAGGSGKPLHYKGAALHRGIPNSNAQGGASTAGSAPIGGRGSLGVIGGYTHGIIIVGIAPPPAT